MMARARRPRHGLPGRRALRLADRARERRLQALRRDRHAARAGATAASRRCSASSASASTSTGCRPSCRAGSAAAWRSRARWRSSRASCSTTRRRPASIRSPRRRSTTRSSSCGTSRSVSSIVVTHQLRDAFYVATHMAVRDANGTVTHRAPRRRRRSARPSSSCCKDGLICFEGDADGAAPVDGPVSARTFLSLRTASMPRTRSLAWSELKIGVLTIVAIVIAAVMIFSLTGGEGLLLAALHAEDAVRQRRRPQARLAGARRRRRGRVGEGASISSASRWTSTFEVNKDMRSRITDRVAAPGSGRSRCSARRRRHHAVDQGDADSPTAGTCRRAPPPAQIADVTDQAQPGDRRD